MSTVLVKRHQLSPVVIQPSLSHVVITGDLRLSVTESDAAYGPITGSYRIETREMQRPCWVLWGADGQVQNRQARATTAIAFEMPGAWRAARPITLYRRIAGVALLLSFLPDILLMTTGYPGIFVGAYILMHIATAAICVIGLTRFSQARDEAGHP